MKASVFEVPAAKEFMTRSKVVIEIEGFDKPALVAEWLGVSYFAEPVAV
jgi:hypothetical protein